MLQSLFRNSLFAQDATLGPRAHKLISKLLTPVYLKQLWTLIIANILAIGCLGVVLVLMSRETSHLILAGAITVCAAAVVAVVGYVCWLLIEANKQKAFIVDSMDALPVNVLITNDKGKIIYANSQLSQHFGDITENFIGDFVDDFVKAENRSAFMELKESAQAGNQAQIDIILSSHISSPSRWHIDVILFASYDPWMIRVDIV